VRIIRITVLAAVALMSLATAALGLRSAWRTDVLDVENLTGAVSPHGWSEWKLFSDRGVLALEVHHHSPRPPADDSSLYNDPPETEWDWFHHKGGGAFSDPSYRRFLIPMGWRSELSYPRMVFASGPLPPTGSFWSVWLPHWLLSLLLGLPVAVAWRIRRRSVMRAARLAAGQCASCGYDLRASPKRCPECGAAATGVVAV
jgi:hypothetical protein